MCSKCRPSVSLSRRLLAATDSHADPADCRQCNRLAILQPSLFIQHVLLTGPSFALHPTNNNAALLAWYWRRGEGGGQNSLSQLHEKFRDFKHSSCTNGVHSVWLVTSAAWKVTGPAGGYWATVGYRYSPRENDTDAACTYVWDTHH